MSQEIKNPILNRQSGRVEKVVSIEADATHVLDATTDRSPIYYFVLLIAGVCSAFLAGWRVHTFIAAPSAAGILEGSAALLLFLIILALVPWLIRGWLYAGIFMLFSAIALFVYFYPIFSIWMFLAMLAALSFWSLGFHRARTELDELLHIRFRRTAGVFLRSALTGTALAIALISAGIYAEYRSIDELVYKAAIQASEPILERFVPEFRPEMAVQDTLNSFAGRTLQKQAGFSELDSEQQTLATEQVVQDLRARLIEFTQTPLAPEQNVLSYVSQSANGALNRLGNQGLGLTVTLFIFIFAFSVVRLSFFVLRPLIVFISGVLYYMLHAIGIIQIQTEQRRKEVIVLK